MFWEWLFFGLLTLVLTVAVLLYAFHRYIIYRYLGLVVRVFEEKPLFIVPSGPPVADAEDVRFPTSDGLSLCGCYLPANKPRQGVILFGLEFGSNRWAAEPYCRFLRQAGFDIFAFEVRNQGDSDRLPGYDPLQWLTAYEVEDFRAALAYLKSRPDADPRGIGFFGISKGAGAGLLAASGDPFVRCFVTDGLFATHTTMIPYMCKWAMIYVRSQPILSLIPLWYFHHIASMTLRRISKKRRCRFPHLEHHMHRLSPRPLLMIHGSADNYIKPEMAQALFERARPVKEFWIVDKANHNQAFQVAAAEYQRRLTAFFLEHLALKPVTAATEQLQPVGVPSLLAQTAELKS